MDDNCLTALCLLSILSAGVTWAAAASGSPASHPHTGEPTYEAMQKVWPRMGCQWTALSPKDARTKFKVHWNGTLQTICSVPQLTSHEDLEVYQPYELTLDFGGGFPPTFQTADNDQIDQRLMSGWLPVVETRWREGGIEYAQTAFATLLGADEVSTGRELSVAFVRLGMTNLGDHPQPAHLWVRVQMAKEPVWKDDVLYDDQGRIRMVVHARPGTNLAYFPSYKPDTDADSAPWTTIDRERTAPIPRLVKCKAELSPKGRAEVVLKVPCYPIQTENSAALAAIDFDAHLREHVGWWEAERGRGMTIDVPDKVVNEVYNSQLHRFFSTSEKDPHTGRMLYKTYFSHYMIAHDVLAVNALDQRGYHQEAGQYLIDSYLSWQGNLQPEGAFKSKEGFLSGPAACEGDEWPVKNGFVLWAACEHYKLSRDRRWLDRVTPNILASCDWIIRERAGTKVADNSGEKAINYGLLPPHRTADWGVDKNGLWTEAWNHVGLRDSAEIMGEIGHPRAAELLREADDYRECIRTAVKRATTRAVKIKLPSGETIPWVPHDVHAREPRNPAKAAYGQEHDGWGEWVEYADCGPLWLVFGRVFDASEPEITWLLRFSEEYPVRLLFPGLPEYSPLIVRGVTFGLPHCYTPQADAYFWSDDSAKYVEAFYSGLAAGLSWKTYIGRDHRAPVGSWYGPVADAGPHHLLRRMLVQEDGHDLWLLRGSPKAWLEDGNKIVVRSAPTYFGPMSYEVRSRMAADQIEAAITPPSRNPPPGMKLRLRLRHPRGKPIQSATVNGQASDDFTGDSIRISGSGEISVVVRF